MAAAAMPVDHAGASVDGAVRAQGWRTKIRGYRVEDGRLMPRNKHKDISARLRERAARRF
jgi:hypothetical protein